VSPGTSGKFGWLPLAFLPGTTIYADSAAGFATAPQLLYQAIGAGNLRAWADTEAAGHAALANLAVGCTP
jgi:hypothetical protein